MPMQKEAGVHANLVSPGVQGDNDIVAASARLDRTGKIIRQDGNVEETNGRRSAAAGAPPGYTVITAVSFTTFPSSDNGQSLLFSCAGN